MGDESPYNSKRRRCTRASIEVASSSPTTAVEDQVDLTKLTSRQLALVTTNEEQTFAFSLRLGLVSLDPGKCPECGHNMRLAKTTAQIGGYRFRCTKECGKSISLLCSTWFESTNLKMWQILALTYHFCCLEPVTKAALQCEVAELTACNWYNFIRGVQAITISNQDQKIGGLGHIVEMDEFHLYTPKYHKGRSSAKGAVWGFGGIDVNTRDVFVIPVKKRDKETLLPLIRKYIYPHTTIYTDSWPSYAGMEKDLSDMQVYHHSVNHKKEFVNSETPEVHTQTCERQWLSFRSIVPPTTSPEMLNSYFAQYLYYAKYEWAKRHPGDRFRLLCKHIAEVYPGPFKTGKQFLEL